MQRILAKTLLLAAPLALFACNSPQPLDSPFREGPAISAPIPPDSPFAKVKIGMPMDQVYATIGPPTSPAVTFMTPKNNSPLHFCADNYRSIAHYKGIGAITFSQDNSFTTASSVLFIDYNPNDPGYAQK
jgi:hypothetical protein